jgi:hypothetical protein
MCYGVEDFHMETLPARSEESFPSALGRATLRLAWHAIRLPIVTLLIILEPFVRTILMGIAMLGVLMCLFHQFLLHDPRFPFWLMLSLSIGSAMLLLPYYALIRLFSIR